MTTTDIGREVGVKVMERMAQVLSDEEFCKMFSPQGTARQQRWRCEDGWIVGYTTERIKWTRTGQHDGKFAAFAYKPIGKGARTNPTEWVQTYVRHFSTRKAARNRATAIYYQHSPKAKARHGR